MRAGCISVAQQLRAAGWQCVGLCPANARVCVAPAMLLLAHALVDVSDQPVAAIDPDVSGAFIEPTGAAPFGPPDSLLTVVECGPKLRAIVPRAAGPAGAAGPQLRLALHHARPHFAHLLADLSSFFRLGDHLNAMELLDAIVIVARAGHVTEDQLLRLRYDLRVAPSISVLLIG
ncbi:MAG: hypothetical protein IT371_12325 [Deltaproteobacteria bacterium]|nr:hypothetical protein [Deltaproteobacteria bacterium]